MVEYPPVGPSGLVCLVNLTILLGAQAAEDWRILIYLIAIPAVVYLLMLLKAVFPVNERVEVGTSYKEMLGEFGYFGAPACRISDLSSAWYGL